MTLWVLSQGCEAVLTSQLSCLSGRTRNSGSDLIEGRRTQPYACLSSRCSIVGRFGERRKALSVSIGIDSHKSTLAAAAVDELGRVLSAEEFGNDPVGHEGLARWAQGLEHEIRIGIECSGSYGNRLARGLTHAGFDVYEVPANLAHREARRQGRGKSDTIDAVAIARVVAREQRLPRPRIDQAFDDLKLLSDHLDQLKRLKTQLTNRIHKELTVARPGYEKRIGSLGAERHRKAVMTLLRGESSIRAALIRRNVKELRRIDAEIKELRVSLQDAVAADRDVSARTGRRRCWHRSQAAG